MLRLVLVPLVLLASALVAPPPSAQAAPTESSVATARTGSYQQMTRGYKCRRAGARQGLAIHKCANITWRKANTEMNGPLSARVVNRTRRVQQLRCDWDESKTWTFTASVSAEVETGAILAKAKVTFSGSVAYSKSVRVGTSVTVNVSPRSTAWCRSGMAMPRFGGKMRTLECGQSGSCRWAGSRDYTAKVPRQFVWVLRERRN